MRSNASEPAYPVQDTNGWNHGLTKRERIAAMAMQGLIASESMDWGYTSDDHFQKRAQDAVANADALLAELAKETGK